MFRNNLFVVGVEKSEAEARWELPEDHVLPGSPLFNLHATEDAEHRPGYGRKPERPAPRPLQVPQRDARPARLPDLQICHVLSQELKSFPLFFRQNFCFLFTWVVMWPKHVINSASLSHRGKFLTWNLTRIHIYSPPKPADSGPASITQLFYLFL